MSEGRRRRIEVNYVGDVAVVKFVDKRILDDQTIQLIGEQLNSLIDDDECKKVLLNFSNVEYLSSAALGKLINLNKKARQIKGQLKLCSIKPEIYEVFLITNLDRVFKIYDDEAKAIETFE